MKKFIILFIVFTLTINIKSQEIGLSPTKVWTDNSEIQNPLGFSIYYFQPIWKLGLKIEFLTATNERNYYGYLSSGFIANPEEIIIDDVKSKSRIQSLEFSLSVPKIIYVEENYFTLTLGMTRDNFSGERVGLNSGKRVALMKEDKFGFFYGISISREKIFQLPIKIELLFKHKGLISGMYVTDTTQPFKGEMDIKELQLNISYVFN